MARMPFCVSFRHRADAFSLHSSDNARPSAAEATRVRVRRCRILDDGLAQVASLTPLQLQGRLSVQFVDDFGRTEAGIDAGGLFKEYWSRRPGAFLRSCAVDATPWVVLFLILSALRYHTQVLDRTKQEGLRRGFWVI